MIKRIASCIIVGFVRLFSRARPHWKGCRPAATQRIYFANHGSHLDFLTIWAALPAAIRPSVRPVAAKDYWTRKALRRKLITNVFNAVLISRPGSGEGYKASSEGIRCLYAALDAGDSLIIFPEGTRGGAEITKFKPGLYHLARHARKAELVPVYLENMNRILPKGEILPVPMVGKITFGTPMQLQPDEDSAAFLARAKQQLEQTRENNA